MANGQRRSFFAPRSTIFQPLLHKKLLFTFPITIFLLQFSATHLTQLPQRGATSLQDSTTYPFLSYYLFLLLLRFQKLLAFLQVFVNSSLQAPRRGLRRLRITAIVLKLKQKLNEKPPSDIGEHVRRQVTRNKRGELVTDPPQIYRHCATP